MRKECSEYLLCWMKTYQARILYPKKLPFKSEREIKNFSDKQNWGNPLPADCLVGYALKKKKSLQGGEW